MKLIKIQWSIYIFLITYSLLQVLLDLARMIFEEQSTIEHMVLRILTHTQSLIQCLRVQVHFTSNHGLHKCCMKI